MKALGMAFLSVLSVATGHCAFPNNLSGYVYYEYEYEPGPRSLTITAIQFSNDGTYSGIFTSTVPQIGATGQLPATAKSDGSYSYTRVSDAAAELILDFPFVTNGGSQFLKRTLGGGGSSGAILNFNGGGSKLWYLVSGNSRPLISNTSSLSFVRAAGSATIGIVAPSAGPILIRAIGGGLAQFGVAQTLRTPTLTIFDGSHGVVAKNSDWTSESATAINRVGTLVGAFPFRSGVADAGLLVLPSGGTYTAQVTSADPSDSGQALIEVYALPFPSGP